MVRVHLKSSLAAAIFPMAVLSMASMTQAADAQDRTDSAATTQKAVAALSPTEGSKTAGQIVFSMDGDDILIQGEISGLEPNGKHGFHVHEKGDCSAPDASSAGGHFHVDGQKHGAPAGQDSHVGDLGNIESDAKGVAKVDLKLPASQLTLADGPNNIIDRALIVHKGADDLVTQPTGDAGGRAACAVITAIPN